MGVKGMQVKDIMYPAHKMDANSTIVEAAKFVTEHEIGSVFIESRKKIVGIVTERDIVRKIVSKGLDARRIMVYEIMSAPIISVSPETGLEEAADIMSKNKIRRLGIIENGHIVGKVTQNLIGKNLKYYMSVKLFKREESPGIWSRL